MEVVIIIPRCDRVKPAYISYSLSKIFVLVPNLQQTNNHNMRSMRNSGESVLINIVNKIKAKTKRVNRVKKLNDMFFRSELRT